jgi:hypothetical protein
MSSKIRARKNKRMNYKSKSPINDDIMWERNVLNNKQQIYNSEESINIDNNTHFLNLTASSQKLIDRINKEQELLKIQPDLQYDNHILPHSLLKPTIEVVQPLIPINYISLFFIKPQSYIDQNLDIFTNPCINQYNNQPLQLQLMYEMVNTIIPYEKYNHTIYTLFPPHQSFKNNYIPNHTDLSDTKYINNSNKKNNNETEYDIILEESCSPKSKHKIESFKNNYIPNHTNLSDTKNINNSNKKYVYETEYAEYDIILEESCSPKCQYKTEPLICAKNHRINDEYYPNNNIIKKGQLIPSHMCKYERPWKIYQGYPLRCNNIKCWFSHISGRIDHINYLKTLNVS